MEVIFFWKQGFQMYPPWSGVDVALVTVTVTYLAY